MVPERTRKVGSWKRVEIFIVKHKVVQCHSALQIWWRSSQPASYVLEYQRKRKKRFG
jgi:hypothetical protein